jgi:uncharacterized protein (AIM24 family)/RNA polymerase subunit RPABC4/transcription elongation factor Spt4
MFCINCGSKIPEKGNFCVNCGSRAPVPPPAPVPVGLPIGSAGQIVATPVSPRGPAKCSWCGALFEAGQNTCPKCGAASSVASVASRSGWAKLPGRKDMAKLTFGKSICQIEGTQVPVADMKLAPEDSIYFTHHVLLWKDPQVSITAMSLKGGWKRMLGGLPLIMTQAQGPGHIAFSQDSPGELIPLPLQHGQAVDVREHLFLAATGNVDYDWFSTNIWFQTRNGDETETRYPLGRVMDRFSATGAPGLLLLHAAGNVFVRDLSPGQVILVKPSALVFKDPTVQMEIYYENPSMSLGSWLTAARGYLWLRLSGPGRVAIQSVFDRIEGEANYVGGFSNSGSGGLGMEVLGEVASSIFESFGDN